MKKTTTITGLALARTVAAARSREIAGFFFAMLLMCSAPAGHAQTSLNNNSLSNGMLVADFNHDGIPDALVNSPTTSSLTVSMGGVPYGTFSATAKFIPYPTGCAMLVSGASVVGDFNGDGFPDIALTCTGGSSKTSAYTVYILLGNGDGTFVQTTTFDGLSNLVAGDFNLDGKADLVAVGSNGMTSAESVSFFASNGDGTFATANTSALPFTTYTYALAVDVNQDGYPDLVLGNFSAASAAETLDIFGNNKNGTFGTLQSTTYVPSVSVAVGSNPSSIDQGIIAGNFYGTGLMDLAVVDTGAAPGIFVIKNTSAGAGYSFGTAVKTPYPALVSATAAPFTSALSDLLVYDGTKLSVLANSGSGVFTAGFATLTVANATTLYAAADANGDGHADVYTAVPNANGAALTVDLLSGTASASSAAFALAAGTNAVSATWPGNVNFAGSTANSSQVVNAISTSVALGSSKNPSFAGDSVTFTATVSPLNSGNFVPGGTVTFTDGANVLGTPTLGAGGVASVTTSALTVGAHTISAVYSGDNIFGTSSAPTISQQVNANVPVITWANPAAITYGTALSSTQLNATAANGGGVNVPGTFVYAPAAGAVLNAGPQTLTVTFTPTDLSNYTTATKTVSLTVNRATPLLAWTPAVSSITYGTALGAQQLNATATGAGGATLGGSFVYTPASGTVLGAGAQTLSVTFTPTDANYNAATTTTSITVGQATPAITWSTPASIAYGTALSATQLNATAAGAAGTTLPGTFVYSPASGAVLAPGTQKLSVTFTPTDTVNYAVATASVNLTVGDLTLTSFTPTTAQQGAPDTTITITGSGLVATTVARVNGTNIATTLVNATTLTAVVPAADFAVAATLQISLSNPATGSVSASLPLTVLPAAASGTLTGPASTPPGSQPALTFTLQPYPIDVTATFTLTAKSALASGVTDPNVTFATGTTSYSFVIKANTTTVPTVQLQAGTVAETITVTPALTANGVNVTPAALTPINIVVPAAIPSATATTLTRNGNQLTVTIDGFSNTREIVQANFHFVAAPGATLSTTDFTAPVGAEFATWFASTGGLQLGSSFLYTQNFTVNDGDASKIASVQVTLTNTVGMSAAETAQ